MQPDLQVDVLIPGCKTSVCLLAGFHNGTQRRIALERVCYRTFGTLKNSSNETINNTECFAPLANTNLDTKGLNHRYSAHSIALKSCVPDVSHSDLISQQNNADVNTSRSRSCSPSNVWWRNNSSQETERKPKVRITVGISHIAHIV